MAKKLKLSFSKNAVLGVSFSIILLGITCGNRVYVQASPVAKKENSISAVSTAGDSDLKKTMGAFFRDIVGLQQYILSEDSFGSEKNEKAIKEALSRLHTLAKKADHEPALARDGFRFSKNVLEKHISDTQRIFNSGNKRYARWMLSATTSICLSCHTQFPSETGRAWTSELSKNFPETFHQAELNFVSRQFDTASSLYQNLLKNYPEGGLKSDQIDIALERFLLIFARIKKDPKTGIEGLTPLLANKALPTGQHEKIKLWLQHFEEWKKETPIDFSKATPDKVRSFAEAMIKKAQQTDVGSYELQTVIYARLSGVLYGYLNSHSESDFTPEVLYWLATCDRYLKHNFFYSLGDIYLKECINRWPGSNIAQKCLDEYQDNVTVSYSGTSGTHLPDDLKAELAALQKKIHNAKKATGAAPKK